jgi:hypothetical protein
MDMVILVRADGTVQITVSPYQWQEFLCVPEEVECEDGGA